MDDFLIKRFTLTMHPIPITLLKHISKICYVKARDHVSPEKCGGSRPCDTLGSTTPVLDFDSGKVGSANHTQLGFQEATHLPFLGRVCGVVKP